MPNRPSVHDLSSIRFGKCCETAAYAPGGGGLYAAAKSRRQGEAVHQPRPGYPELVGRQSLQGGGGTPPVRPFACESCDTVPATPRGGAGQPPPIVNRSIQGSSESQGRRSLSADGRCCVVARTATPRRFQGARLSSDFSANVIYLPR